MLSQMLVASGGGITLTLGTLHLVYSCGGAKLRPRDPELEAYMKRVNPVLTRQTTMWRGWVGFNMSHSLGAMLFGLLYGYLALAEPAVLFGSTFLAVVGGLFLFGYVILGFKYWFSVPLRGVLLALVCYVVGFGVAWV
ncbi:MAG: LIC_13387 family protein [Gemmatimonadaceae bacterium]